MAAQYSAAAVENCVYGWMDGYTATKFKAS